MKLKEPKFEGLKKGEKRAALFSDSHLYESEGYLPENHKKVGKGEEMIAKDIEQGERRFILSLEEAKKIGDINFLFFGGDMVSSYGDRGIVGPHSQEHVTKFKQVLDQYFEELPKKYMAGNHDLGYVLPLSSDPEGGMTEASVEMFEKNFNQLFYTFSEGQYKFVVLSSDLAMLKGGTDKLLKRKEDQKEFYKDEITYTKPGERIVLMIHDPDALAPMFPFLLKNLQKIEKTFSGHQHAQWVNDVYPTICYLASSRLLDPSLKSLINRLFPGKGGKVLEYFRNNKNNAKVWDAVKLSIMPAPGGVMGMGGGFLVADLKEDGIEVKKVKLPPIKKIIV